MIKENINIIKTQNQGTSLVVRWLTIRLPMQGAWVQSLGQVDTPEKGMATHSSILAWEIPWSEDPGRLQSMESQKSWTQMSN